MRKHILFLGLTCLAAFQPALADNILACPGFETTADSAWWYRSTMVDSV
jgi:hypothetical protein